MDEQNRLGFDALEIIKDFVINIGSRPAGRKNEKKILDSIADYSENLGLNVSRQAIKFANQPAVEITFLIAGVFLCFIALVFDTITLPTLVFPIYCAIIPNLFRWSIKTRRCTQKSENLYVTKIEENENPELIFCAHVDTARNVPVRNPFIRRIYNKTLFYVQRLAIFLAAASILISFDYVIPELLLIFIKTAVIIFGFWMIGVEIYSVIAKNRPYTIGANDNTSGVAVCMVLSKYFSENPSKRLNISFLYTGAEETGLHGARAFANELKIEDKKRRAIVNLDQVGSGLNPTYVRSYGGLFAKQTSSVLNLVLKDVEPTMRAVHYSMKGADFEPFVEKAIAATSFEMAGNQNAEISYHSEKDSLDIIDVKSLNKTIAIMIKFAEHLPYSDWVLKGKK